MGLPAPQASSSSSSSPERWRLMSNLLPSTSLLQDSFCVSASAQVCFALKPSAGSHVCVLQQEVGFGGHEADDGRRGGGKHPRPQAGLWPSQHLFSLLLAFCCMFLQVVKVSVVPMEVVSRRPRRCWSFLLLSSGLLPSAPLALTCY